MPEQHARGSCVTAVLLVGITAGLVSCQPDRIAAPPGGGALPALEPVDCGAHCVLANAPPLWRAARSHPDSSEAILFVAEVTVKGRAGDPVAISLDATARVREAIGSAQHLLVAIDGGVPRSFPLQMMINPIVVYRFSETGTITLTYSLDRHVRGESQAGFQLIQQTAGHVISSDRPWVQAEGGPSELLGPTGECPIVAASGTVCDVGYTVSPFFAPAFFGATFQSDSTTGPSRPITVTFQPSVKGVTVIIYDPDYAGNRMIAYDSADVALDTVNFSGDRKPGKLTTDTQTIAAVGIRRVDLIPSTGIADGDLVAYDVSFEPDTLAMIVECTPNPVVRGDEVTCKARLNTGQEFTPLTVFGRGPDDELVSATFEVIENGRAIQSKGRAVFTTNLEVTGSVFDVGDLPRTVMAQSTFSVTPRSSFPAPSLPGSPLLHPFSLLGGPSGGDAPSLGSTERPRLNLEAGGTNLEPQSVNTGPNAGYSYLLNVPPLRPLRYQLHQALFGLGSWFEDQDGDDHGSTTGDFGPYCTGADITGPLREDVIRHEVGEPPARSHYSIWLDVLGKPETVGFFEGVYFSNRASLEKMGAELGTRWNTFALGLSGVYQDRLDEEDIGPNHSIVQQRLGCSFDNNPGD